MVGFSLYEGQRRRRHGAREGVDGPADSRAEHVAGPRGTHGIEEGGGRVYSGCKGDVQGCGWEIGGGQGAGRVGRRQSVAGLNRFKGLGS